MTIACMKPAQESGNDPLDSRLCTFIRQMYFFCCQEYVTISQNRD